MSQFWQKLAGEVAAGRATADVPGEMIERLLSIGSTQKPDERP
jgi:hypothetical protein